MQLIYQINSVNKKIHSHFNWCKEILIKLNFHSQPKTQEPIIEEIFPTWQVTLMEKKTQLISYLMVTERMFSL